jgi:hypothetical protein
LSGKQKKQVKVTHCVFLHQEMHQELLKPAEVGIQRAWGLLTFGGNLPALHTKQRTTHAIHGKMGYGGGIIILK